MSSSDSKSVPKCDCGRSPRHLYFCSLVPKCMYCKARTDGIGSHEEHCPHYVQLIKYINRTR